MTNGKLEIQKSTLPLILFGVVLLFWLNSIPAVHGVFVGYDTSAAIAANALLGTSPVVDQTLGWLNTRLGDAIVLTIMSFVFIAHASSASTFEQMVERLSFWAWLAVLCVGTYLLVDSIADFYHNPIPLQALPGLYDLRIVYGIPLHSSAFNSYPSGHGLAYLFFAFMAWHKRYNAMSLLILALGAVMLSVRVILGMHWLSDILLGALPLALVLGAVALDTPLRRSYYPFYSVTFFLLSKLVGESWLYKQFEAAQHQLRYQLPSWANESQSRPTDETHSSTKSLTHAGRS
jgi:membrane-associated phospholipid phosphatase